MKRLILALAALLLVTIFASDSYAWRGRGQQVILVQPSGFGGCQQQVFSSGQQVFFRSRGFNRFNRFNRINRFNRFGGFNVIGQPIDQFGFPLFRRRGLSLSFGF